MPILVLAFSPPEFTVIVLSALFTAVAPAPADNPTANSLTVIAPSFVTVCPSPAASIAVALLLPSNPIASISKLLTIDLWESCTSSVFKSVIAPLVVAFAVTFPSASAWPSALAKIVSPFSLVVTVNKFLRAPLLANSLYCATEIKFIASSIGAAGSLSTLIVTCGPLVVVNSTGFSSPNATVPAIKNPTTVAAVIDTFSFRHLFRDFSTSLKLLIITIFPPIVLF